MKKALVLLAPGFEEIETVTVIDILRRAGVQVTAAATVDGPIEGSRKVKLVADGLIDAVRGADFDLIVLPGGQPGTRNLGSDPRVKNILDEAMENDRLISAICAAPSVLSSYGFIKGKKATSHPSVRPDLRDVDYQEARVVVDGNWVTSRSPGTAMEFAFKLVELLKGPEMVAKVNDGVMARL
ncbi:MAG: DJ-1 family glyoxalase III [Nitrospiria bacterium]